MKFSDEMLMAYADDELDAGTRAEIEASMARDPEVARAVERHRAMSLRIRAGYESIAKEPVPDRLAALVAGTAAAPVVDMASKRAARGNTTARWRVPPWAAIAASVVVAVVGVLLMRGTAAPYEEVDGVLVARGPLDKALTTELASRPSDAGVGIGVSFTDREGNFCRTFHLRQESPVAGLACRSGTDWELRVLADAPVEDGEVRPAGAMPIPVLQAVDAAIDGEPLDAAAEAAARDAGWRKARNVAE
jgi:hypothetical protein